MFPARIVAASLLAAVPILAWAGQPHGGSIKVTVVDESGAFIPCADVSARMEPDTIAQQTQADEHGVAMLHLAPGNYAIAVRSQGFSVWTEKNVEVSDSSELQLRAQLRVTFYSGPIVVAEIRRPFYVETSLLPLIPVHELKLMKLSAKRAQ